MTKITVAKNLGFLYTASRYNLSPPERGIKATAEGEHETENEKPQLS